MTDEEKMLRAKFYLAPNTVSLDQLRAMNEKYTAYPGLTREQVEKLNSELMEFKSSLDPDGIAVYRNGIKVTWPK